MRIGVDTGGTFTDCVVLTGGQVKVLKVFSTPADASRAIVQGVQQIAAEEASSAISAAGVRAARGPAAAPLEVIHGTTVGTNSLLERRGARVALVTTAGFEDLLEIGRQARPQLYNFNVQRQAPLAPRAMRFGLEERVGADGKTLVPISNAELRRLLHWVRKSGAESMGLCLLFAFANPVHERRVAVALAGLKIPLSISHEILPEFREYERLSTVVINAYLAPRMGAYLQNLERSMRGVRLKGNTPAAARAQRPRIYVMQSSGGIFTAARAAQQPVRTILSGPAGGVVASAWLAQQLKLARAISFDMGGTSTDVCLLDGTPRITHETTLGGLPVAVPVLDVHSVGAGGGSLARIDAGGALRVGPESAGAVPGPICYGKGGAGVTVTDANLILGRLDPVHFLGGEFRLDREAAERGFADFLSGPGRHSGFRSAPELALGMIAVANGIMEKALRVISVERGYDPRDFALICYGGAGGSHAADLARSMGLLAVIVPQNPGAFSALGILLSDVVRDVSQSVLWRVSGAQPEFGPLLGRIESQFERLHRRAVGELRREGFDASVAHVARRLDLRYQGQAYELSVPYTANFVSSFHDEHTRAYGYAYADRSIEIVNLRMRLTIPTPKWRPRARKLGMAAQAREALMKTMPVWFGAKPRPTGIYDRQRLAPGARLNGPAIVLEYSSTTVVPSDFTCAVDRHRNLVIERRA